MNPKQQYLDLWAQHSGAIDRGSAPVLNALRPEAAKALAATDLPVKGMEGFERTDVAAMFAPDYGLNINRIPIPADIAASHQCQVTNLSTLLGFVAGDTFIPSPRLDERLPEGVIFTSLRQAAIDFPEIVSAYYGTLAPLSDPAVALNTLLVQDGVFIRIPASVHLAKPLQLVNLFASPADTMSPRRVLIVMEPGATAQILVCDHTYNSSARFLSSEVIEIAMSDGAHLDYYTIEESSPLTTRHSQLFARQSSRSDLMIGSCTLTAGNTRNSFVVTDAAPGAATHIAGMAIASAEMHVDNSVNMIHCTDHTNSRQLFKYVVSDKASCAFSGRILVSPDAAYTDAYQTCRSVLDGTDARMYSKPQLEIYNDEVKCSHGTTTGQLDNEALFYMQTRGIPLHEARIMLMQAFMADVIDTVRLDPLRDRLRHLVDARFSGASSAACSSCQAPTCSK